ncbi:MAG: hypothetical protein DMD48_10415 [Gemmatimonadetes bacterium]|nr:MAG: hypothetical protein DMD48_10415 [Gemmatimonadota bacterium]
MGGTGTGAAAGGAAGASGPEGVIGETYLTWEIVRLQSEPQPFPAADEAVWHSAPPATDFRQNQPHEGQPATQRTEVRFAFDGAALYVGARMLEDSGARGVRTVLARRDADFSSDYLQVIFDTYHDHIGRLFFLVNPSGVKQDANGLGGGGDPSWDPVWEVKTTIDSLGWTAEMRIPFSQLRFPSTTAEQTWGMQIWRQDNRLNELSQWSFWGLQETGGPPRFGHLHGLIITSAPGRAELLPYVVGRSSNIPGDTKDPFYDPHALDGRLGADARVLLTSNLTLNATVNPDFGQVEVDPAVVNLTDVETTFDEKRPFFVEGVGYFGLGPFNCFFCSNVSPMNLLSTRRIGRAPQLGPMRDTLNKFADVPESATILGAAKLTGRTPSGWSIGALDAVTRRERATVQRSDLTRVSNMVEPPTNYFVGRVQKDLRGGATQLRVMGTSVYRDLSNDPFAIGSLSHHSEALGVGTEMWFSNRNYRLLAQAAGTQVSGDAAAMLGIQRSPLHYFQRPDRDQLDSTRTALRGYGGYARLSHEQGKLLWEVQTNIRSPGFDANDITFFQPNDFIYMGANLFPQWTKPTSWYRQLFFIVGGQQKYNFAGDVTNRQFQLFGFIQPHNYWNIQSFWMHRAEVFDDRATRGGPVVKAPGSDFVSVNVNTDFRKRVVVGAELDGSCNREHYCSQFANVSLQLKPASNVQLTLGPSWSHDETGAQFVSSSADSTATQFFGRRVVFAQLFQNSIGMNTRFNVTFSPTLTLELFMQPLIQSGTYSRWREFATSRTTRKLTYGVDIGTVIPTAQGDTIDPDGAAGPAKPFFTARRDFTFRSLRGNTVLRWEYRPGSTLFVVWTRSSRIPDRPDGDIRGADLGDLFQGPSENIFLVKVNYWLGF